LVVVILQGIEQGILIQPWMLEAVRLTLMVSYQFS
jgi:hypothetical protein